MKEQATFAGGCFWCIESAFLEEQGVLETVCGYTGGRSANPTYEEVCGGATGHFEAVEITFNPEEITYLQLLDIFWRQIDPFDPDGQFADRGSQYQTAIFVHNAQQKAWAEATKKVIETNFQRPVATKILAAAPFCKAEIDHQAYCKKRPEHYQAYASSHLPHLTELWKNRRFLIHYFDLKEWLTPLQYRVTQESGTEPPFHNAYWDQKKEGIYVDLITGEPLFLSSDKFDSGTGWPSFTRPIDSDKIETRGDCRLGNRRTEVRCGKSHLGHLFADGPPPIFHRYCLNSAALRFIPKEKMAQAGYASYIPNLI